MRKSTELLELPVWQLSQEEAEYVGHIWQLVCDQARDRMEAFALLVQQRREAGQWDKVEGPAWAHEEARKDLTRYEEKRAEVTSYLGYLHAGGDQENPFWTDDTLLSAEAENEEELLAYCERGKQQAAEQGLVWSKERGWQRGGEANTSAMGV